MALECLIRDWPQSENPVAASLFARIEQAVFVEPWTKEKLEATLDRRNVWGLLCELEQRCVGYVLFHRSPNGLFVIRMAVAPNLHRYGIGSDLLACVKGVALRDGLQGVSANVHERNVSAQQFLKAVGFRCEKTLPRDGWQDDEYLFQWRSPNAAPIEKQHAPAVCCGDDDDDDNVGF